MNNKISFLRTAMIVLAMVLACRHESRCQTLTSPGLHAEVYPSERVSVIVSDALCGHQYVIVNRDDSEMAWMSSSGSAASTSIDLPEGEYSVKDEDGTWQSPYFTVSLYSVFQYIYPELSREYAVPPSGGTVTIELTVRRDDVHGVDEMICDEDSWYQLYDPLGRWNSDGHNPRWNGAFSWSVECDEDECCVRITVSAPANLSGHSRSTEMGLCDGQGHAVVIVQEPLTDAGGESGSDDGFQPYSPSLPSDRTWVAVRSLGSGVSSCDAEYFTDVYYFNGLGFLSQSVRAGDETPDGFRPDIVTIHGYDGLLRETTAYLPYAAVHDAAGGYDEDGLYRQGQYYADRYGETAPYSKTRMEFSAYGRILGETLPGEVYQSHGSSVVYLTNEGFEMTWSNVYSGFGERSPLRLLEASVLADGSIGATGFWPAGSLMGTRICDGDGRVSVSWKDFSGNLVAQDRFLGDTLSRVLYVYDSKGRLACVMTGSGYNEFLAAFESYCSDNIEDWDGSEDNDWLAGFSIPRNGSFARRRCYLYTYDGLGRVVSKRIPGREAEIFTYDALDRVITSRDGNQRANGITICNDYDNVGNLTRRDAVKNGVVRPMAIYTYSPTTGLKTAETVFMLSEDGWVLADSYLSRTFSYDSRGRLTESVETESGNEYFLTTSFVYDLADNLLSVTETCVKEGETVTVHTGRSYDSRGRLVEETVSVDDVPMSSVAYGYDELGRQCRKDYGCGSESITEETSYTVQGWTASTWSSLLTQSYAYEDSVNPSWTGNITRWDWRHLATADEAAAIAAAENGTGFPTMSETFAYDSLGRLSGSSMTRNGQPIGNAWSERNISYDLEGNILSLDRYQDDATDPVNQLRFTYAGPRRSGYGYDSNGNVTRDPLRHFEIRNNLLNLPSVVWWSDPDDDECEGYELSECVMYADGTRAGEMDVQSDGWFSRYVGSLIYDGGGSGEVLRGVVTADGFISVDGGSVADAQMQYFLRDHLGSVRVIATDRQHVVSRDDYLPFGVRMTGNGLTRSGARSSWFGFSGKENEMFGDGGGISGIPLWQRGERYQHFGARTYDPATCIFLQVDPMAEKFVSSACFSFCSNDPINRIDPTGQADYFNENGSFLYSDQYNDGVMMVIKQTDYEAIQNDQASFEINLVVYSSMVTESFKSGTINDDAMLAIANHYNKVGVPLTKSSKDFQMESNNKTPDQHFQIEVNVLKCVERNIYDSYYNLDNAINDHEGYHIQAMKSDPWRYDKILKNVRETNAYKAQMESPSWEKTTAGFKHWIKTMREYYDPNFQ